MQLPAKQFQVGSTPTGVSYTAHVFRYLQSMKQELAVRCCETGQLNLQVQVHPQAASPQGCFSGTT